MEFTDLSEENTASILRIEGQSFPLVLAGFLLSFFLNLADGAST
jgi:hypothetical protein